MSNLSVTGCLNPLLIAVVLVMGYFTDKFVLETHACTMRLLWLAPRVAFFLTSEMHVVISSVSVSYPFDTTRSLSAEARPFLFLQQHSLSLSTEGHSLDLCAQMSPPAYPVRRRQLRALWGLRDGERGQSGRWSCRPPRCHAAVTPPLILLLGRFRLVESSHQGGN
jgi:hypothetical protein